MIKKRKKFQQSHMGRALQNVTSQWSDGQWVTEIFTPGTSVLVTTGEKFLKDGAPAESQTVPANGRK